MSKRLPVDLIVSASVPFLAVWLYEAANWIVLAGQGYSVSFSTSGWLPLGVAGVSSGDLSPLTKALQIGVAIGLLLPLGMLFSKTRLLVAHTFMVSTLGIYLASAYWEMLNVLTVVPMVIHTGIFITGTSALVLVLLRRVSLLRYPRITSSSTRGHRLALP